MSGSCYLCCRRLPLLRLYLVQLRRVGRREQSLCDQCARDLWDYPRLFWQMSGVELVAAVRP